MSLRDYFIAHAPAEPQPWFSPDMPPKPKRLSVSSFFHYDAAKREQLRCLCDFGEDSGYPIHRDVLEAERLISQSNDDCERWESDYVKQRCIQWPAAWADAVLAERLRGLPQ